MKELKFRKENHQSNHLPKALILGGTDGLGRQLALEAAKNSLWPVVTGRRSVLGDKELREICSAIRLDLSKDKSVNDGLAILRHWFQSDVGYVFWNAGVFLRKPMHSVSPDDIDRMINVHLRGPMKFLQGFHKMQERPYHLVVIASTSSWRVRVDETLYCALKAAKAAFARNFARELVGDLFKSKVTLVNPGGMKTPNFWEPSGQDISGYMDPKEVAEIIWREVLLQKDRDEPYHEVQILRNEDGSPRVEYGPKLPELPF